MLADTVRFLGSQKSRSSETTDRAYGEGEGERDGQDAEERSSLALFISEVGWMNTVQPCQYSFLLFKRHVSASTKSARLRDPGRNCNAVMREE